MPLKVLCIDGPTASGKGTLAARVAQALGFAYLDSGALYRIVAWQLLQSGCELDEASALAAAARLQASPPRFEQGGVIFEGQQISDAIRAEVVGNTASKISVHAGLRQALVALQRAYAGEHGLVADGRDMGSVIFPDSALKVYLTASAEVRAARRYKQLIDKGISAILENLVEDLRTRDLRDTTREHAPLKPAADALMLDNSSLSIEESVAWVVERWREVKLS